MTIGPGVVPCGLYAIHCRPRHAQVSARDFAVFPWTKSGLRRLAPGGDLSFPSGPKDTEVTAPMCPARVVQEALPVFASKLDRSWSSLPDAIMAPVGLYATERLRPKWSKSVRIRRPPFASHIFSVHQIACCRIQGLAVGLNAPELIPLS